MVLCDYSNNYTVALSHKSDKSLYSVISGEQLAMSDPPLVWSHSDIR